MAGVAACYAGCGKAWAACYTAVGLVAGTIVGSPLAPPAALACNAVEGVCMIACFPGVLVDPTVWMCPWLLLPVASTALLAVPAVIMKKKNHLPLVNGQCRSLLRHGAVAVWHGLGGVLRRCRSTG
jgi:hypothetical protein